MNAPSFRPALTDLAVALGLLTRIPLPTTAFPTPNERPAAHAAWAYPLVGLIIGGLVWGVGAVALWLGLPAVSAAVLALLAGIVVTGAMHEDGLADCADGFWGGWTANRRLEIMKDSQVGTYGVIALIAGFALKGSGLMALLPVPGGWAALLAAAVVSRAAMVVVMRGLPNARDTGLSKQTGRPPRGAVLIASAMALFLLGFIGPDGAFAVFIGAIIATVCAGLIARTKIGGQTGDVLGATQQVVEITTLLIFAATLN